MEDDRGPGRRKTPNCWPFAAASSRSSSVCSASLSNPTSPILWPTTCSAVRARANSPMRATTLHAPAPGTPRRSERPVRVASHGARSAGCSAFRSNSCTADSAVRPGRAGHVVTGGAAVVLTEAAGRAQHRQQAAVFFERLAVDPAKRMLALQGLAGGPSASWRRRGSGRRGSRQAWRSSAAMP